MADLGVYLMQQRIHAALLQEPYVLNGTVRGLPPELTVFPSPCRNACVVINTGHGIQAMQLAGEGTIHSAAVHIRGWFGEMVLVSMYFVYRRPIDEYLITLQQISRNHNEKSLIVGMDANAISHLWFSKWTEGRNIRSAERGVLLGETILGENLVVLNKPSDASTFSGPNGVSDIDVTVCNTLFDATYRATWEVRDAEGMSDHQPLLISVSLLVTTEEAARPQQLRWYSKGIDWAEYIGCLRRRYADRDLTTEYQSVDIEIAALIALIHDTNDAFMPRHRPARRKSTRWWNADLAMLRRHCRHARRLAQRARSRGDATEMEYSREYRTHRLRYQRALHDAKKEEFHSFVNNEGNDNPWGEVYKWCRGKRQWHNLCAVKNGPGFTSSWSETVDALVGSFFPAANAPVEPPEVVVGPLVAFTHEEVAGSVHRNSSGKAPGLDGITSEMVRRIWYAIPDAIVGLFNRCLADGVFPTRWKEASLVIILKSPDKDPTEVRSYRPICLLNVLGKTMERLMVERLVQSEHYHRSGAQYGFTQGRSTEDAWLTLKAFYQGSTSTYLLAVSIDFRGAFDNLLWDKVLQKISSFGVAEYRLWQSYFHNRRVCVIGNAETRWSEVSRGCPQGSICGPAIWNMVMEDLLTRLLTAGHKSIAYADDLLIAIEGSSRVQIEQRANMAMNLVSEWGLTVGVEVNPAKTTMTLLRGKLDAGRLPRVKSGTVNLKMVNCLSYLGVSATPDRTKGKVRFMYHEHLRNLRTKLIKVLFPLKRVMRKEWGLRIRATRKIYLGLIVPCITYAAIVWSDGLLYASVRDSLQKMQRIALLTCVRLCRTVPVEAMQVILGELPWDLEISRWATIRRIRKGLPLTAVDRVNERELIGLGEREVRSLIEERLFDEWQARWDTSSKGRTTYEWIPQVRYGSTHPEFEPSLQMCFLLTGHGSLSASLHRFRLADSPICACGQADEDWQHVTVACPLYADIRDLTAMDIRARSTGGFDFSHALSTRESYVHLGQYAKALFGRRAPAVIPNDDNEGGHVGNTTSHSDGSSD